MVIFDVGISGLKKQKWTTLSQADKKLYAENILSLIKNAYRELGGHPNYQKVSDVYLSEGDAIYRVIDLDNDPDIDAVQVMKKTNFGNKFTATGQDGTKPSKKAILDYKVKSLKTPYFYVEVSGKLKDILLSRGVPIVRNPLKIRQVLKGKKLRFNNDGTYQRKIGNKVYTKMLVGTPNI